MSIANDVAEAVLPRTCVACSLPCDGVLCGGCDGELDVIRRRGRCGDCGKPMLPFADACASCHGRGHRPGRGVEVVGVLEGPLEALVLGNKFGGRWWCGEAVADLLWDRPTVRRRLLEADAICPVPLHRVRQFGRGYNQAAAIAGRLARLAGLPVVRPVVRRRGTLPQSAMRSNRDRAANLRRAFAVVDPMSVRGRSVVLVDDVITTGTTIRTFGRCVARCGTADLTSLAAAVARPRGWEAMRPAVDAAAARG